MPVQVLGKQQIRKPESLFSTRSRLADCLTLGQAQNSSDVKRILLFGDSNTWGFIPVTAKRYPRDVRWSGVLAKELGTGYEVIEEGLTCRTADIDDSSCGVGGVGVNGAAYLPAAITSHAPLDLVVIMLGTNDTRLDFGRTAKNIADSLIKLADMTVSSTDVYRNYPPPKVLLVSPVPLGKISTNFAQFFDANSVSKSKDLAGILEPLAKAGKYAFFDAATLVSAADGSDGVHLSAETHAKLGKGFVAPVVNALK